MFKPKVFPDFSSKLLRQGLLVVLLPFGLNICLMVLLENSAHHATEFIKKEEQESTVVSAIAKGTDLSTNIFLGATRYIASGGDLALSQKAHQDLTKVYADFERLRNLIADDQHVAHLLNGILESVQHRAISIEKADAQRDADDLSPQKFKEIMPPDWCKDVGNQLMVVTNLLRAREAQFQQDIRHEIEEQNKTRQFVLIALLLNLIIAGLCGLYLFKNIASRLKMLMSNARSLSTYSELPETVPGDDELSELDLDLHAVARQLAQSVRFRRGMMQMFAHDIKLPLTQCLLSLDSLRQRNEARVNETGVRQLRSLYVGTQSCLNLIDDILVLESIETNELALEVGFNDIRQVVARSFEVVNSLASAKKVELENQVESQNFDFDGPRVTQVLINLLSNAIKFSPPQGIISVSGAQAPGSFRVSISDQGPGIDENARAQLFQKFYQTDDGKKAGGTGLGLAISRLIVTAHGGTVGADSTVGEGSTFWFELPLQNSQKSTPAQSNPS